MGIFFEKPTKGPDVVGGIWPIRDRGKFWNRTGRTVSKGDIVQIPFTPGEASEIATNDSNSYRPGRSNDTVWNTIIDPIDSLGVGYSLRLRVRHAKHTRTKRLEPVTSGLDSGHPGFKPLGKRARLVGIRRV